MDISERTSNIIRLINRKKNGELVEPELIRCVCEYYDYMRLHQISTASLHFLRYISKEAGVPQYYYMLERFETNIEPSDIDINTMSILIYESTLHTDETVMLHRYQMEVLNRFTENKQNRYFLSASTSFGKTFLVYEIIRKMDYDNVFLIFPTLALLSENMIKIYSDKSYTWIKDQYKIHTLSEVSEIAAKNIYIFTPERFLSFIDKYPNADIDFFFVDEAYKLDNEYIVEEEQKENERDVAYRLALQLGLSKDNTDALLAGPYIEFIRQTASSYNPSFDLFCQDKKIEVLDYNNIEIVSKCRIPINKATRIVIPNEENFVLNFEKSGKVARMIELVHQLINRNEQVIIYASRRSDVQNYASSLCTVLPNIDLDSEKEFVIHLHKMFKGKGSSWCVCKAIEKGVGIHHGLVPKFIQNEIIRLFNEGIIRVLICTTTITEGVNTTAKNMIAMSGKKSTKKLKSFDAKNIEGRSGRFLKHYQGRLFILDGEFTKALTSSDEGIKHKNYDLSAKKTEIDIQNTDSKYLSPDDLLKKRSINFLAKLLNVSPEVLGMYKTVPTSSKLSVFDRISKFTDSQHEIIAKLKKRLNSTGGVTLDGVQLILDTVVGIIPDKSDLRSRIEVRTGKKSYSLFTYILPNVLSHGFEGSVNYYISQKFKTVDDAVKEAAKFSFTTLRYEAVKYFGIFNLMYKYYWSVKTNKSLEEITCIDKLLRLMEYNAVTDIGRKANDLGATFNTVNYFDNIEEKDAQILYDNLDDYEKVSVEKIKKILIG